MRRFLGGGTTFLDRNQIFYQCIFHHSRVPWRAEKVYQMMLDAPVMVLNRIGLRGRLRAVNEVEANSLRIAGIGGGRVGDAMVVVGNLLFDFDYSLMSSVWKVPDQPFRNLALETMEERVGTLNKLGCDYTLESLESHLAEAFAESLERPLREQQLKSEEIQAGRNTASDLASREFLSLHHPVGSVKPMKSLKISADVFIHHIHFRFEDQEVDVSVRADKGIIKDLQTESPKKTKIRKLLIGTPLSDWT
jgi:lipoate-protein ligase A